MEKKEKWKVRKVALLTDPEGKSPCFNDLLIEIPPHRIAF